MMKILAMDDLVLMQVDQRPHDLMQVILHFNLRQSLPSLYQLVQGLVGAYLQQDVHVVVVLEDVFKLDDVLVAEGLVDLDFGDELDVRRVTFCLARDRFKEFLAMILAARTRLVSRLVTS